MSSGEVRNPTSSISKFLVQNSLFLTKDNLDKFDSKSDVDIFSWLFLI
jgi:hypothetical protein